MVEKPAMNERATTPDRTGTLPVTSEREKMLTRIREALTVPAPRPGVHGPRAGTALPPVNLPGSGTGEPALAGALARRWLPKVGETVADQLALFARNAAGLKADFQLFDRWEDLCAALTRLRDAENWRRVASHQAESSGKACAALQLPVCWTDRGYDVLDMEQCDAGITECDALIAQTGSVLVTSRSAGGRALSILPPHHVVIARREQLVADLPAAFELIQRKYAPAYPSMISFITGPSRTGDIERILVLGAHGPKKLTIYCV
jgi:L-lactate dehydrogenase complex protein LldG